MSRETGFLKAGVCLWMGWAGPALAEPAPSPAVRIWCKGQPGAGFVFRDKRHVLTAFDPVRSGRGVKVIFADGTEIDAETVAVDREAGLALLQLEADAPVAPMVLGEAVAVGAAVQALVPDPPDFEGEKDRLPPARVPGTVAAVGAERLQVAVTVPAGAAGSPLVDGEGRVVGLVRGEGTLVSATPAGHFTTIGGSAEKEDGYWGEGMFQLRGGWLMRAGDGGLAHGPRLSLDLVGKDRLYLSSRVGLLFGDSGGELESDLIGADSSGAVFDAEIGWRFALPPEIPLQIALGVGATSVAWMTEGHRIGEGEATRVKLDEDFSRPMIRLGLGIPNLFELDYGLEIDLDDPSRSMLRLGFSVGF